MIASGPATLEGISAVFTGCYSFVHKIESWTKSHLNPKCTTIAEILKNCGYNTYAWSTGPLLKQYKLDKGFNKFSYRSTNKNLYTLGTDYFVKEIKKLKEPWFLWFHLFELHRPRQLDRNFNNIKYGKTKYERALSSLDKYLSILLNSINLDHTILILTADHGENLNDNKLTPFTFAYLIRLPKKIMDFLNWIYKKTKNKLSFIKDKIQPMFFYEKKYIGIFQNPYHKIRGWSRIRNALFSPIFKLIGFKEHKLNRSLIKYLISTYRYVPYVLDGHGFHLYDFLLKIPFIIVGNNIPYQGETINAMVRQIDILPTIMKLLNIKTEIKVQGNNILPPLLKKTPEPTAFMNTFSNKIQLSMMGIRTEKWKYIKYDIVNSDNVELYDLQNDPQENYNVIKKYPDIGKRLMNKLNVILEEKNKYNDQMTVFSKKDEEIIKKRLRALGYID